jgi:hypothetical protein
MKRLTATSLKHWLNSSTLLFALLFALVLGAVFEHQTQAHIAEINTPFGRHAAEIIDHFYSLINPYRIYFLGGILLISMLLYFCETPSRKVTDLLGALLCVNVFFQVLLLNLLLLTPMREGSLLLIQLLLFLPEITIAFGWLYSRMDTESRQKGGGHIKFEDESNFTDGFDYFYISAKQILVFESSGAVATTKLMKTLFLLHGLLMMDLVALTLSRAMSLAV